LRDRFWSCLGGHRRRQSEQEIGNARIHEILWHVSDIYAGEQHRDFLRKAGKKEIRKSRYCLFLPSSLPVFLRKSFQRAGRSPGSIQKF
jgi:hypothetical protein